MVEFIYVSLEVSFFLLPLSIVVLPPRRSADLRSLIPQKPSAQVCLWRKKQKLVFFVLSPFFPDFFGGEGWNKTEM